MMTCAHSTRSLTARGIWFIMKSWSGKARGRQGKGMFSIGVYSADGRRLAFATGEKQANLLYEGVYQEGDEIRFESETAYARVRVDAAVDEARVYLPEKRFTYRLPLSGDNRKVYAPGAFGGETHLLSIRVDEESGTYNLACNPADQRGEVSAYPHATANVETRNESVFCARNVIDGLTIAAGHGIWPYESWGIGARQDAYLTVDFGREVELDRVVLYLRADFPHDAWWISGVIETDGGARFAFPLEGMDGPQTIELGGVRARTLTLKELVKCDMPSAFPSLRQLMAYGRNVTEIG